MNFIDIIKSNKRKKHFEEQISIVYKDIYKPELFTDIIKTMRSIAL